MLFGILGKFCAIFITIPYPVLGGAAIVMFSTFTGVALSNLQVNLDRDHNLTLKAPITTAADDIYKYFIIIFQRK